MIGIASALTGAIGVIGSIRRAAGSVQAVRGEFRDAGGGARGVAAGARLIADRLLPDAAQAARREIDELRSAAVRELNGIIGELRGELASLRSNGGDPLAVEAAECQLLAATQRRRDVQKAAVESESDIQACELDCVAHADMCRVGESGEAAAAPGPAEKPVVPFLRQGVQERFPHDALRRAGCYFFALYRWAEHELGRPLGEDNVVPLFEMCVANGSSGANAFINDPARALNTLCGAQKFSRVINHTNDPGARPVNPSLPWIRRVQNGGFGVHFVLDINGYTWDSLGSNASNYRPAGLREIAPQRPQ